MTTISANTKSPIVRQPSGQRLIEIALIFLVFFIVAGDRPPHVNEAHYVCRLKHFWNPQWCAGDLFLESRDSQYVFLYAFGWLTRFLTLAATTWVGRAIIWAFLAFAWQRLSWRVVPLPFMSVLSAALFVALNSVAHMAGEWVVGGIESKCVAYGFVLVALSNLVDKRWNWLWIFLGAATAFHPLVGGWSMSVCAFIWLIDDRRTVPWFSMLPGIIVGGLLALVGVVPALMLTWSEPPELVADAAQIYVFERLPHHLAPLTMPTEEVVRRLGSHVFLILALFLLPRAMPTAWRELEMQKKSMATQSSGHGTLFPGTRAIIHFAWGAVLLAAMGFVIELALWSQPALAAKLLRYYWFRLTDFGVPMAVAILVAALISAGMMRRRTWSVWLLLAALTFSGAFLATKAIPRALVHVPPADAKLRDYDAWVDVCKWASENTPEDALFLTPRLNLSFKWYSGRPEVVNRKDVPQDARSIVEWHRRINEIYYATIEGQEQPLDSLGVLGTERVRELAREYGAAYVLMDRGQLLRLPIAYWNDEYVVYRIQE
jgi:hypothetical protein